MKYDLSINQHNIKPHLDIEEDIQKKKDGLFTFNLRVNQGNIEDYSKYETITAKHYQGLVFTVREEWTATYDHRIRSKENGIRNPISNRKA